MKIKRVKLLDGGFKGVEVEYHKLEKKGGRSFNNKTKDTLRFPVHLALENKFKELRPFLLDICKLLNGDEDKMTKDFKIAESEMISVEVLEDGFVLAGESVASFSNKMVSLKTPKVYSSDNYHDFDAVQLIIKELIEEVNVYMDGSAKPSDEEVLIRWVERHNDQGIDIDTIKGMSADEQKQKLTELLEKAGAVVMWNEEMEVDEEALAEGLDEMSKDINEDITPAAWNKGEIKEQVEEEDVLDYNVLKAEKESFETELPEIGEEVKLPIIEKRK